MSGSRLAGAPQSPAPPPQGPGQGRWWRPAWTCAAVALLSLASVVWTKLALAAAFLTLVAFLALPPLAGRARRGALALLVVAALASSAGFFRFALQEAIPGVIAGGRQAAKKHALAFARSLVAAQDHLRRSAPLDHDADGVGSAASLLELAGLVPLRNGQALETPPVYVAPDRIRSTPRGTLVQVAGYLYLMCLPERDGGYTGHSPPTNVDEERAERDYLIYAWPLRGDGGSPEGVLFLDAYEAILEYQPPAGAARYHGELAGPECDSALDNPHWRAWKDKTRRDHLPGDTSASRGP